jgi:phosphohistidine phosphatase SixA
MKSLALLLTIIFSTFTNNQVDPDEVKYIKNIEEQSEVSTYYLIRHAEKVRSETYQKDPVLMEKGIKRAENWALVFKDVPLDMVYSTNYNRTKATALPTAISKNLEVSTYDPNNLYDANFQETTKGKTVLVVGHSNTTPAFVNAILKEKKYEDLPDDENGALFIITVCSDNSMSSQVLYIN